MIESNSSIGTFMTCPKLYQFKYIQLLRSLGYSSAMGIGTFLHAQVESYGGGSAEALIREIERMMKDSPDFVEAITEDARFAQDFFTLWRQRWDGDHPFGNAKFEWVDSEAEWAFNVTEAGDKLAGKRDGLVRHKEWGSLFLYELKTATDRDRDGYIGRLEIDSQVSSNILALRKAGLDVQGVLYDVAWKPAIRLKTGRKTMPDETVREFHDRMIEAIKENPEEFFQRQIIYRNDNVLKFHEEDLVSQMATIKEAHARNHFHRNTKSCNDYGRLCQFFSVCIENKPELESLYARKTRKLPELSKEIQDADSPDDKP